VVWVCAIGCDVMLKIVVLSCVRIKGSLGHVRIDVSTLL
jgi:hypothetical protein